MKIKLIAFLTCVFMLFTLPSYGATPVKKPAPKKKTVTKVVAKPPLDFNFILVKKEGEYNFNTYETSIITNSIGTPELILTVVNTSQKPVVAFEFQTSFLDAFNRPVYRVGTKNKIYTGIVQNTLILPEKTKDSSKNGQVYNFNLVLYRTANTIKMNDKYVHVFDITLSKVKFSDGSIWTGN